MASQKELRILLVDDNKTIHADFYKILNKTETDQVLIETAAFIQGKTDTLKSNPTEKFSYCIDSAYQGEEALELVKKAIAEKNNYALAFVDIRMPPGWDGIETIKQLWAVDPDIQIVICTAYSDYSWKLILQNLHYSDNFLILKKPFDVIEVRQLALSLTKKWLLKKEMNYQIDHLLYQATHDNLTGLPNRILLMDRLNQAIIHAKQDNTFIGVLAFDLDNIKEINDSLGHTAGDVLLKNAARRLVDSVAETDTVVRLGGDEFVVILSEIKREEDATAKAKELLNLFLSPCQIEGHSLAVTSSIGVSIYPKDGKDAENLLRNADTALYRAKELGKNNYQVYLPELNEHMLERAELVTALREAVEKNELVLHYQPLVQTSNGRIIGMEALVRWNHPTLGLLYPQSFISLAEETGLIVPIGEWVLKEACAQTKKWQDTIDSNLNIAINVSGYQFRQNNFLDIVKNILTTTGLDPHFLELEMTESLIFKNIPDTSEKMHQLKKMGVHLSIDDFGTGYASFSYLKYFPFDKVKIDQSFVKGIHLNDNDNAIIEAIINMTRRMGIEVLAEGVEKPEQAEFLVSHHGNQVQGYYYSKPLDAEASTELLQKHKTSKMEFS